MAASGYMPQRIGPRTRRAIELRGWRPVTGDYARFGSGLLAGLPRTLVGSHRTFELAGRRYPYLFDRYKWSWLTERAVEVPLVRAVLKRRPEARVLEVGHVLGHYGAHDHLVVDRYEQAPGVLNRDVLELADLGEFDVVVSISTIEHVGWDEDPRDPDQAARALHGLEQLLAPGGRLVVTVPVGYHAELDRALMSGAFRFASTHALRREKLGPHWLEADADDVWGTPYDFLLYSARAVFIGEIERPVG
jgi:SAM-dependent methyltransferase